MIRFFLFLLLFIGFNSHADGLSEPSKSDIENGLADPVVTAPAGVIQLPKRPRQATKKTCEKHSVELFNKCKHEMDLLLISQASIGAAAATAAEGGVDKTEAGEATTQQSSQLSQVQSQYCQAAAEQCRSVCTEAKDYHTGKAREASNNPRISEKERELARGAVDVGNNNCGKIQAVAIDSNLTSESLAAHSQGMGETADSMKSGGEKGKMGKLMGPMMGAAGMLGAMCLMGRGICEKDDDEGGDSGPQITSENQIDCNLAASHKFSKCESHFINMCTNNTSGTGCDEFNNLYCGMDISTNTSTSGEAPVVSGEINKITANAGVGSTFCQYQVAVDYCKEDDTGACPSCRQIEQSKSPVCKSNPALCLPGWTNAQLDEAKSYCPTDPMFITAATSGSGSTATTDTGSTTEDPGTTPSDTGTTTGGVPTGEGSTTADNPSDPDSGTGTGDGTPSKTTALNEMGGATTTNNRSSSSSGSSATSLVGSAFGPSLFVSSSQIYKERCELGLIDNCGPREGLGRAANGAAGSSTQ